MPFFQCGDDFSFSTICEFHYCCVDCCASQSSRNLCAPSSSSIFGGELRCKLYHFSPFVGGHSGISGTHSADALGAHANARGCSSAGTSLRWVEAPWHRTLQ